MVSSDYGLRTAHATNPVQELIAGRAGSRLTRRFAQVGFIIYERQAGFAGQNLNQLSVLRRVGSDPVVQMGYDQFEVRFAFEQMQQTDGIHAAAYGDDIPAGDWPSDIHILYCISMRNPAYPRVGIGVFVWKDGRFLAGQRLGAHGGGTWSIPGGHLEFGESWEDCARREVAEETGLEIVNVRFLAATNDIFTDTGKHYVTIWVESDWSGGEPQVQEPDKLAKFSWQTFKSMPRPRFLPWLQLEQARPDLFT